MKGWIKLHRQLCDNRIWTDEPFSRGQAWVDLLMLANTKPGTVRKRGKRVDVQRGQVGVSIKGLAARWQWSRGKVRRFIDELENEQQIVHQITNVTTVLTIINYDAYQQSGHQNAHETDTKRTPNGHKQEGKELKEGGGVPPSLNTPEFTAAWSDFLAHVADKDGRGVTDVQAELILMDCQRRGLAKATRDLRFSVIKGARTLRDSDHDYERGSEEVIYKEL